MKWMAFALVLIGISSSQVHYQWTSQKNLILFSVRHRWTNRPTVTETGVEPPKLRFADEFVHSPFLKMSSCFSFRASMNKVVPARSCHRAYILNYIVESRTVTVSPTELYLIRI